jgi:hypothetical protein
MSTIYQTQNSSQPRYTTLKGKLHIKGSCIRTGKKGLYEIQNHVKRVTTDTIEVMSKNDLFPYSQ